MASIYGPDLTGQNPDYKVTNKNYVIFTANQRIEFYRPVYLSSLSVTRIGTINVSMNQSMDWIIEADDIDYTAISEATFASSEFDATLVKSIKINASFTNNYTISIDYQALYPDTLKSSISQVGTVDFSPELIVELAQQIANIQNLISPVNNSFSVSSLTPKLLEIDLTGLSSENYIIGETQTINTFNGLNKIKPLQGSFYQNDLIVKLVDTNKSLTIGNGFTLGDCNLTKTKLSSNIGGVFDFLVITEPYAGPVTIEYQAFGGRVTQSDVSAIYKVAENMEAFLGSMSFLTTFNLPTTPIMNDLTTRLRDLETRMRCLLTNGVPTYGDFTSGMSRVYKLALIDTNFHWFNIGSLYKATGASDIVISDRLHYRLQMLNAAVSTDIFVNVNLSSTNPMVIESIATNMNNDISKSPISNVPQFRIVYDNEEESGIYLQIGFKSTSLIETLAIQDLSGSESCWILPPTSVSSLSANDDNFLLPDNSTLWSSSNSSSESIKHTLPNKAGYVISTTSIAASAIPLGTSYSVPLTNIDPSLNIADIKEIEINMIAVNNNIPTIVSIPMSGNSSVTNGSAVYMNSSTNTIEGFSVNMVSANSGIGLNITADSSTFYMSQMIINSIKIKV